MIRRHLVAAVALALVLIPSAARAWWNDDWSFRKKITVDAGPKGAALGGDLGRIPLLIRLHEGNFKFDEAKDDGSDLRFIAGDDKTPLKYHIEKFDAVFGLAFIWVDLPELKAGSAVDIWMYYGNAKAPSAVDSRGTYDADQVLVYHFAEKNAPPRDQSAYKNDAQTAGSSIDGSLIGGGLKLDGSSPIVLPASPSLAIAEGDAMTWSAWIKPQGPQATGIIFARHDGDKSLVIGLDQGSPYVAVTDGAATARSEPIDPLAAASWHHLAITAADQITLFVDGQARARVATHLPPLSGIATLGGNTEPDRAPFVGELDELEIAKVARPPAFIAAAVASQGTDARLVTYGGDEQTASWSGGYFGVIIKSVTLDGWIVIAILALLAVVSWTVMANKAMLIRRTARANEAFLYAFRRIGRDLATLGEETGVPLTAALAEGERRVVDTSSLYRIYQLGTDELRSRFSEPEHGAADERVLSPQAIAAIRAVLDAGVTRETQRLNSLMVLLTIAISGGPFLGLLGTVVGVMITFAAIAASGDVNVNAIAPGIAAALVATVAGLGVAIPALFGYNYLITRIKDSVADMHVFVDELTTRLAEHYQPRPARRGLAAE